MIVPLTVLFDPPSSTALARPKSVIFGVSGPRAAPSESDCPGDRDLAAAARRQAHRPRAARDRSGEQDVRGLQVAVDDVLLVGEVHRPGQRFHQFGRRARRLRMPIDERVERAAVHEFEREVRQPVVLADLVDLDDVRVLQPGDGPGFLIEAGELLRAGVPAGENHLEGDEPIQPRLPGLVDDAHAAAAQLREDLVAGNLREFTRSLSRSLLVDADDGRSLVGDGPFAVRLRIGPIQGRVVVQRHVAIQSRLDR